jgi:hypothetical protein
LTVVSETRGDGEIGCEQQVPGISCLDQRHYERHLRGIAAASLTVESHIGAAFTNGFVNLNLGVAQSAQVSDADVRASRRVG